MYKKILIPIALDHVHQGEDAVAVAKQLADEGAELVLIHVEEEIPGYARLQIPDEVFAERRKEAEVELQKIARNSGVKARSVITQGHPGTTLVGYAEDQGMDCIVIHSHRPGLADYFLGSTAARVVRHAPCAVHVMR